VETTVVESLLAFYAEWSMRRSASILLANVYSET
jgi:hypothetical protein